MWVRVCWRRWQWGGVRGDVRGVWRGRRAYVGVCWGWACGPVSWQVRMWLCCSFAMRATPRGEGASLEVEVGSGRRQTRQKGGAAISLHLSYISASARVGGLAGGGRRGRGGFGHWRWRWRWRWRHRG